MSKKIILLITGVLVLIIFVGAKTLAYQDVCGDHICGNEGYDTCPEDCDHCVSFNTGDIYSKGYVIYNWNKKYEDVCEKDLEHGDPLSRFLFERSCQNERGPDTGGMLTQRIECKFGCEEGACLKTEKVVLDCTDTDGGSNYYTRGITRSGKWERVDTCTDVTRGSVRECQGTDCRLSEFTCGDNANPIKEEWYKCPVGCKDGACISCKGCVMKGQCFDFGMIMGNSFCDKSGKFVELKVLGSNCIEDYECENNNCVNGKCLPKCEQGCIDELFKCLSYGTVLGNKYCDKSGELLELKSLGGQCEEDYECENNNCFQNRCLPKCDEGCIDNSFKCLPYKSRVEGKYCDSDGFLKVQKEDNKACINDYECKNNICKKGICLNPNPFMRIINWFKRLFYRVK